jgi:hypothetical protein
MPRKSKKQIDDDQIPPLIPQLRALEASLSPEMQPYARYIIDVFIIFIITYFVIIIICAFAQIPSNSFITTIASLAIGLIGSAFRKGVEKKP